MARMLNSWQEKEKKNNVLKRTDLKFFTSLFRMLVSDYANNKKNSWSRQNHSGCKLGRTYTKLHHKQQQQSRNKRLVPCWWTCMDLQVYHQSGPTRQFWITMSSKYLHHRYVEYSPVTFATNSNGIGWKPILYRYPPSPKLYICIEMTYCLNYVDNFVQILYTVVALRTYCYSEHLRTLC